MEIRPQPGPQEIFLSTSADIAIYGGAAGGGKTFALLLENLRHSNNGAFGSVIFRRNATQITNQGGLWDNAMELYPYLGAIPKQTPRLCVVFTSGAKVSFSHLQLEKDVNSWQGAQIPLICYDELTHFTEYQFFYMLSRNRSMCGVRPYVRATTNPDADSWVAKFISWWIDQKTGYPIPERSGVIRYFIRLDGDIFWTDRPEELMKRHGVKRADIKSVTFISSSVYDNKILLSKDPTYLANLKALPTVDRERLLGGNWKIRASAGMYFKRTQVKVVEQIPAKVVLWARAWDMAATEPTEDNKNPDATAGVLIGKMEDGNFIVADCKRQQIKSSEVRILVKNTAITDKAMYRNVRIRLSQDPGQAGKEQAQSYVKYLTGFSVSAKCESGDKITRAEPLASQWQQGNVYVLAGAWNDSYFDEMEAFPEGKHDDRVDGSANAFNELNQAMCKPAKVKARSV